MDQNRTSTIILWAITAIIIGWGGLWLATKGATLAFVHQTVQYQTASVSETPSPAPAKMPATDPTPDPLTIMLAGDAMFDRNIRALGNRNGFDSLLAGVAPLFAQADIAVANLEGPITANPSKTLRANGSTTSELSFTFPVEAATALAHAHIALVSLANNHTDNAGMSGFKETRQHLIDAGVQYFGSPWNGSSTEQVVTKNGITVAFVGYHAFQPGFERVLSAVRRLSAEGDFVIVMPHWGEEYVPHPSDNIRAKARALVEVGAKAVIGAHPHVISEQEWVGDVPVFYSLGNLLFDQYFSSETMKGDIAELRLVSTPLGPRLDRVRVYETSMTPRRGVTVSDTPVDFSR